CFGVIDALLLAAWGILGNAEEIEENLLRFNLVRPIAAGIVPTVIVVVPGGQERAGLQQFLIAGYGGELLITRTEFLHVLGVAINVVADEQEQIRLGGHHGLPDRLRPILVGTRTERNARKWRLSARRRRNASHDKEQGRQAPHMLDSPHERLI